MDTATLVEGLIDEGKRALEALVQEGFPVDAALWLYAPEAEEWNFILSTPLYDEAGTRKTYSRIRAVLNTLTPPTPHVMQSLTVVSPMDEVVKAIRFAPHRAFLVGRPLHGEYLGDVYLEDAYVYQISEFSWKEFWQVELPRRAVPLKEVVGSYDPKAWNSCVLAGLLGVSAQQVLGLDLPKPLTAPALENWLTRARGLGMVKRWERDPMPKPLPNTGSSALGFGESDHSWAYRMAARLHERYYPVLFTDEQRLLMVCGTRQENPQDKYSGLQVLISTPVAADEWLGTSDFFRRLRWKPAGEFFVKPGGERKDSALERGT